VRGKSESLTIEPDNAKGVQELEWKIDKSESKIVKPMK
jgi:hypothetical protein